MLGYGHKIIFSDAETHTPCEDDRVLLVRFVVGLFVVTVTGPGPHPMYRFKHGSYDDSDYGDDASGGHDHTYSQNMNYVAVTILITVEAVIVTIRINDVCFPGTLPIVVLMSDFHRYKRGNNKNHNLCRQ